MTLGGLALLGVGPPGPIGVCVDRERRVWVSATNNLVEQFTDTGQYLSEFGGEGSWSGQFHTPHGLALDSRGHLYMVDARNCRIHKFAV